MELSDIAWHFFVLLHELKSIALAVWTFLNSQFALTLIGTGIAAFSGVLGAHAITEKNKRREDLLKELRITNAAIMVSFEICNSFLSLKKQYVRDLGENFSQLKNSLSEFHEARKNGQIDPNTIFELRADFRTLNPMTMPDKVLAKQVFEQISPGARAYTITNTLIRTIDSLNLSIITRNDLINRWNKEPESLGNNLILFYFGLPDQNGHVDQRFANSIEAICSQTDDCIYFSQLLCNDLVVHGEELKTWLRNRAPNVNKPLFDKAIQQGLMPDSENYTDWLNMFVKNDDKKKQNFISYILSLRSKSS